MRYLYNVNELFLVATTRLDLKIKTLYENFKGLSTIGTAILISSGLGALFWFYMASALGPDSYGQISYFIAIAIIGSRISLLGLGNTMMVYTAKGVKIQAPIYLIAILGSIVTSLVLFFVFLYVQLIVFLKVQESFST